MCENNMNIRASVVLWHIEGIKFLFGTSSSLFHVRYCVFRLHQFWDKLSRFKHIGSGGEE